MSRHNLACCGFVFRQPVRTLTLAFLVSIFSHSGFVTQARAETEHPTHVTRGEIHYNSDTQILECAVCLYEEDVRSVMHRMTTEIVDLDRNQTFSPLLKNYVAENFWIANVDKVELPLQWMGYEVDREGVWVYFEVPLTQEPTNLIVASRLMMDVQPGNVGVFKFSWDWRRSNMLFNSQHTAMKLDWRNRRDVKIVDEDDVQADQAGRSSLPDLIQAASAASNRDPSALKFADRNRSGLPLPALDRPPTPSVK